MNLEVKNKSLRELHKELESKDKFVDWFKKINKKFGGGLGCLEIDTKIRGKEVKDYLVSESDYILIRDTHKKTGAEIGKATQQFTQDHNAMLNQVNEDLVIEKAIHLLQKRTETLKVELQETKKELENTYLLDAKNGLYNVGEAAKIFASQLNIKMGRNRLYSFLRANGYLNKVNAPKQNYIDSGYFKVRTNYVASLDKTNYQTLVTGKGMAYLSRLLVD